MRHLTLPDSNVTSAKTKLPQQAIPARQVNEHAGATDSQIRPDKNRSFCPSAAKMNGSSPLSRPKETIIRAAPPPFARNTVQIVHPAPRKTRRIARYVPLGPKRAILRNSYPATNIRPASRQRSTCEKRPSSLTRMLPYPGHRAWCGRQSAAPCESRTMPIAECASGTWGRAGAGAAANRPPPAHRGPCPWPNAHRAPGTARAQALPHPGRRA